MAKLRLLILFGGASNEYENSCKTAAAILHTLQDDQYDTIEIDLTDENVVKAG